jgi:hypothetical protein
MYSSYQENKSLNLESKLQQSVLEWIFLPFLYLISSKEYKRHNALFNVFFCFMLVFIKLNKRAKLYVF